MEKIKADLRGFRQLNTRRKAIAVGVLVLLVLLIAALCITINMRTNIQRKYTEARNRAGEALYSNLYILTQAFDMTAVPNADVKNAILPQMRDYYMASITLNSLLAQTYGPRYAVLSESDINSLTSAFTAYETAFANNTSTDLAWSDMQTCMTRIRELLNSRYSQGELKAGR